MDGARLLILVQGSIPINGNHNLAFLRISGICILPAEDWAAMAAVIYMFLIYYLMEDGASLKIWVQASIPRVMSQALLFTLIIKLCILLPIVCLAMVRKTFLLPIKIKMANGAHHKILGIPLIPSVTREHYS